VTLVLSLILALITASFTLWLVPWSLDQEQKLEDKARSESGLTALMPGRFQQASNQKAVIFVQRVGDEGDLEEVFVAQHTHNQGELQSG
ncbi:LptF/LptG family permease, partial [Psychrobacter sp. SIMBA_152]